MVKLLVKTLCIFIMLNILILIRGNEELVVNTTYGTLMGKFMTSQKGKRFTVFLGIPYAAPPTGQFRFMPPQQPMIWEGTRNATEEGNACIQRDIPGKEDCLYLNVFKHNGIKTLLPVMVFIHGGGFYGGSSALDTYGPELFMDRDVVLVTIQYRLGVFGFLSTEDQVIPGNMGLKDQRRALQWVQENIRYFGGDSLKVTIFGNSAGSASVHLHMISPSSKDLFAAAISQSGTALSPFLRLHKGSSKNITANLAENLNCSTNSSAEILQCLHSTSSSLIQKEYSKMQNTGYSIKKILFGPVLEDPADNAFLTVHPKYAITDKPWIVGVNANEGLFKINLQLLNETIPLTESSFQDFGPSLVFLEDKHLISNEAIELIFKFYFKNANTTNGMIKSIEKVITDSWFVWPTIKAIQLHIGPLYCYLFDHVGQHSFTQTRGGPLGFGVSHTDELRYFFSQKKMYPTHLNVNDTYISKLMLRMWTNFAKEYNPTPDDISDNLQKVQQNNISWVLSNSTTTNFFHIQTHKLSLIHEIFPERVQFWRSLELKKIT